MKKNVAIFRNEKYDYEIITGDVPYYENDGEHVIISKIVEIDFPELDHETIVKSQVAVIENQITKVMADSEASITALNKRKQELLALTHEKWRI